MEFHRWCKSICVHSDCNNSLFLFKRYWVRTLLVFDYSHFFFSPFKLHYLLTIVSQQLQWLNIIQIPLYLHFLQSNIPPKYFKRGRFSPICFPRRCTQIPCKYKRHRIHIVLRNPALHMSQLYPINLILTQSEQVLSRRDEHWKSIPYCASACVENVLSSVCVFGWNHQSEILIWLTNLRKDIFAWTDMAG